MISTASSRTVAAPGKQFNSPTEPDLQLVSHCVDPYQVFCMAIHTCECRFWTTTFTLIGVHCPTVYCTPNLTVFCASTGWLFTVHKSNRVTAGANDDDKIHLLSVHLIRFAPVLLTLVLNSLYSPHGNRMCSIDPIMGLMGVSNWKFRRENQVVRRSSDEFDWRSSFCTFSFFYGTAVS